MEDPQRCGRRESDREDGHDDERAYGDVPPEIYVGLRRLGAKEVATERTQGGQPAATAWARGGPTAARAQEIHDGGATRGWSQCQGARGGGAIGRCAGRGAVSMVSGSGPLEDERERVSGGVGAGGTGIGRGGKGGEEMTSGTHHFGE